MNLTRDRVQSIGWFGILIVCGALTVGLTLRVNAVKSQVHDSERKIVALQRDIDFLETEFQTRSNQQQLKAINDIEFGYLAPKAGQYVEGERQLAALGMEPVPGAPAPIRYASADPVESPSNPLIAMVSPVTDAAAAAVAPKAVAAEVADGKEVSSAKASRDPERERLAREASELSRRLASVDLAKAGPE